MICTHFNIFSLEFFSPSQISLTPESSRRLLFRFISFRMVLEERTVARTEQLFSVSSQLFSLNTTTALFIIQQIFNTHQINSSSYLLTHVTDSTFILNKTKVINSCSLTLFSPLCYESPSKEQRVSLHPDLLI